MLLMMLHIRFVSTMQALYDAADISHRAARLYPGGPRGQILRHQRQGGCAVMRKSKPECSDGDDGVKERLRREVRA